MASVHRGIGRKWDIGRDNGLPAPAHRVRCLTAMAVALLTVSSCATADARSDEQQITASLLKTLTSGGKPICVDSGTYGKPLAVFRTMLPSPDPVRRMLHWSLPAPLQPGRLLSGRELVNGELRDDPSTLPEFRQDRAHLTTLAQGQLNSLARMASIVEPEQGGRLEASPQAPLATVRWWPLNRLDPRCGPAYTVSRPVMKRSVAFVTVTAAHQGTTYAFQKNAAGWSTIAKWSNWLY